MSPRKAATATATAAISKRAATPKETALVTYSGTPTVFSPDQIKALSEPTPDFAKRQRPGGGRMFTYVPYGYVAGKLNQIFGYDWDFILKPYFNGNLVQQTDATYPLPANASANAKAKAITRDGKLFGVDHNLTVYGELTVRVRDKAGKVVTTITKPGIGSQIWHEENEYGDAVKAAKSDALKVAAHEIGIALDLYWDETAEYDKWQEDQDKERAALELAAMPSNAIELIARAQAEFNLDAEKLCLSTTPIISSVADLLAIEDPEAIRTYWRQLREAYGPKLQS